ncbi:MAG: hypothetical protein ACI841_002499, partial [Planctomycetota bacterium]
LELLAVTEPLHIVLYGYSLSDAVQSSINPGNDLVASPFRFDPRAVLQAEGIDGASEVTLGWNQLPPGPSVIMLSIDQQLAIGSNVTLEAQAAAVDGSDLSTAIEWSDGAGGSAVGATFNFAGNTLGLTTITATITDAQGRSSVAALRMDVIVVDSDADGLTDADELTHGTDPGNPDSDGDGLTDGAEVHTHLTSPLEVDSDFDGLPDGLEIDVGTNPMLDDAALDLDNDGFSNLQEFFAGTAINDAAIFPGASLIAALNLSDMHDSITLTDDRLGVTHSGWKNCAVRDDLGVGPGEGFFYFEAQRMTDPGNFGYGLTTRDAPLDTFAGANEFGVGMNTLGSFWHQATWQGSFTGDQDHFGIALDYRGSTPIVHFITSSSLGGLGELVQTLALPSITDRLYATVYGYRLTNDVQSRVNFGTDLDAQPFSFDAISILAATGIDGFDEIVLRWGPSPTMPGLSLSAQSLELVVGESVTISALATGTDGADIGAQVRWYDEGGNLLETGVSLVVQAVGPGILRIVARVTDAIGLSVESDITLTVTP